MLKRSRELKRFRHEYPDSVMTDQALQSLGDAALAANQPAEILAALDAYPQTKDQPALLFLRAEARENPRNRSQAAADYESVYLRFPTERTSPRSRRKAGFSAQLTGRQTSGHSRRAPDRTCRPFSPRGNGARRATNIRTCLPQLSGADRERAELRILESGIALGRRVSGIAALKITDPDVDAERFYSLANYYRDIPAGIAIWSAAIESAAVARARQPLD